VGRAPPPVLEAVAVARATAVFDTFEDGEQSGLETLS